jgi:hypothetical protein
MFCAPGSFFVTTERVRSRFHVLRSWTRFWQYRQHLVPFSCFALPYSFLTVRRASCPVFMFCVPGPVFGGSVGIGSNFHVLRFRTRFRQYRGVGFRFHVLCSRTHFRRYRGRRVSFSCFALPDLFLAVPSALRPVFMFCAPGPVFVGTDGIKPRFHVLLSGTRFQ